MFYFAKSDSTKNLIYAELKSKKILEKIVLNGNDVEQEYCFKLIYQLCFDKSIAQDIYDNKSFYEAIKFPNSRRPGLIKNRDGILWVIEKKLNLNIEDNLIIDTLKSIEKHIMISYNKQTRDTCIKLKKELEKAGYKVWIDVDHIDGYTLEAIAKAIENSSCVFICLSEKYKESPNCRLEAEYVVETEKPFLPLIMEKGYNPSGW